VTALAALAAPVVTPDDEALVRRMLAAPGGRGGPHVALWRGPHAVLAAAWPAWEAPFAEGALAVEGDVAVVADAALHYRADLRSALAAAGVPARGDGPAALVLAAWRAWGERLAERLEGDFAFVLWDGTARRLVCARDFHGARPLARGAALGRLAVASTAGGVLAVPGVARELDLAALGEDLASISSLDLEATAWRGVRRVPAGRTAVLPLEGPARARAHWEPPVFDRADGTSMDEAAERLRETLVAATRERLAPSAETAVWLSGGYDSTAVLAAAGVALAGRGGTLRAVSMSYPPGDPGREDERIAEVAAHCGVPVTWVRSEAIAPLGDVGAWGAARDEPAAHAFEAWNRALAGASVADGARVTLNGNGGDQFFGVSPVFLADLLMKGRSRALRREAAALGIDDRRTLAFWAVWPLLSDGAARLLARWRGGHMPRHYLQEELPAWLRPAFVRATGLDARRRPRRHERHGESLASAEAAWYLQGSFGPKVIALATGLVHAEGALAASPLYDGRVIRLAAARPREERCGGGEKKRLLRRAMAPWLPASVLAPRPRRTGLPGGWLQRWLAGALGTAMAQLDGPWRLAELGVVEPGRLEADRRRFESDPAGGAELGGPLFRAMAAEAWLRTREGMT
jgi:asparagine synthase (glutamine-hydrolysing)